jgi:hypothetical protein
MKKFNQPPILHTCAQVNTMNTITTLSTGTSSSSIDDRSRLDLIIESSLHALKDDLSSGRFVLKLDLLGEMDRPVLSDSIVNSMFVPGAGNAFLELLETIPDNSFIIGIGYPINKGGDAQQGITGTSNSELDNSPMQTVQRETMEETGLTSDKIIFKEREEYKKHKKQSCAQIWYHHITNISDCMFHSEITCQYVKKKFDNKQRKISNIVYGTSEEMIKAFVQIASTRFSRNDDNISYLVATPIHVAKELVKVSMRENGGGRIWTPTHHNVSDFV